MYRILLRMRGEKTSQKTAVAISNSIRTGRAAKKAAPKFYLPGSGLPLLLLCLWSGSGRAQNADTLTLLYENPRYQSSSIDCADADSTRPESTLASTEWSTHLFSRPDTTHFSQTEVGLEGQTDSTRQYFPPGSMGATWVKTKDAGANLSCLYSSYVFAFPYREPVLTPGLRARYSDNPDFSGDTLVVVDSLVNFSCGSWPMSVAPIPSGTIGPGLFAVRWTGSINLPAPGMWSFCVNSDDGARLWIDGLKLVDRWSTGSGRIKACGMAGLSTGWQSIVLEYYQNGGGCGVTLSWTPPGGSEAVIGGFAFGH